MLWILGWCQEFHLAGRILVWAAPVSKESGFRNLTFTWFANNRKPDDIDWTAKYRTGQTILRDTNYYKISIYPICNVVGCFIS